MARSSHSLIWQLLTNDQIRGKWKLKAPHEHSYLAYKACDLLHISPARRDVVATLMLCTLMLCTA